MLGLFPQISPHLDNLALNLEQSTLIKDQNILPHVSDILGNVDKIKTVSDINHVSNIIKQTSVPPFRPKNIKGELSIPLAEGMTENSQCLMQPIQIHMDKLKWSGLSLPKEEIYLIEEHLRKLAKQEKTLEVRFFGKVLGLTKDYYIIQGIVPLKKDIEEYSKGAEKKGQGVNYYTFWVSTNLLTKEWTELPTIKPEHVKIARKIKLMFSGQLGAPIESYPPFEGQQRHYLKAQLVRMISSLQLTPKGIYKVNDDNPKIIEFEEEPKVPEFSEMTTLEGWLHRNQNLLQLGRYTHYIDPATPEDQLEAVTAQLTEKDPQIERLRGITQDKLPEGNPLNLQNVWQVRVAGDNQVFQKDESSLVYAVSILKNTLWPGWVTIGYKGGYCNYYTGYGHKWNQSAWSEYENQNIAQEAEDTEEFGQPNPKEQPKVEAEGAAEEKGEEEPNEE